VNITCIQQLFFVVKYKLNIYFRRSVRLLKVRIYFYNILLTLFCTFMCVMRRIDDEIVVY